MQKEEARHADVLIIGGGVLGVCVAYWVNQLYDVKVTLLERENDVGSVTTRRNTGVIHRPFYLDPLRKRTFAMSAQLSYSLWKELADKYQLPWKQVGTLEIAKSVDGVKVLESYRKWSTQNGMGEDEALLLNRREVSELEPSIISSGGILSTTDTSTDFQALTSRLAQIVENSGVTIVRNCRVNRLSDSSFPAYIETTVDGVDTTFTASFIINAAGGSSLSLAHKAGLGLEFAPLFFRGEYWKVKSGSAMEVRRNIYSVPNFREFPFLDPHLILRHDGNREIGPNAVPVTDPNAYTGISSSRKEVLRFLLEGPRLPKLRLFINRKFLNLAAGEWRSSLGKKYMLNRINSFIPSIQPSDVSERGIAGIRASVIDRNGFVPEAVTLFGNSSMHIVNYNSPGATGAPAFSLNAIRKAAEKGYFDGLPQKSEDGSLWKFENAVFD